MRPHFWILNEQNEPVPTIGRGWSYWFGDPANDDQRVLLVSRITLDCEVSTVFIGIDYNFGEGPARPYETRAFGAGDDAIRAATEQEAVDNHWQYVKNLTFLYKVKIEEVKTEGRLCMSSGIG